MKIPLDTAKKIAGKIAAEIAPLCLKVEIAGSIRRGRPMVGDIDLVVLPSLAGLDALQTRFHQSCRVIQEGSQNAIYQLANGVQLDVFFAWERRDLLSGMTTNWGSLLLCRTGSKEHNLYLLARAKRLGLIWRPYSGVFDPRTKECLASTTEADIFRSLQLDFIPPEKRER